MTAKQHAQEASRLLTEGDRIVREGAGPGEPSRIGTRNGMYERAIPHALTALALIATRSDHS